MQGHYRWVIVALLFFISMTNCVDRASISYAIPKIVDEFHFNEVYIGYILSAFAAGYLLTIFIGGILADKYGSRLILTVSCILWMFATMSIGLAHGFFMFIGARVLLGIAEGPNYPCVTKTIKEWLPIEERNRAFSLSIIATPLSLALSGPIVTQLIAHFEWRGMYFALAFMTLLFVPFWWFLYRDNPANSKHVSATELSYIEKSKCIKTPCAEESIWRIIQNKTIMANNFCYFVFGFYLFFFMNWLPIYLHQRFNCSMTKVGLLTSIPWLSCVCSMFLIGWFTDNLMKKTSNLRYARTFPLIISNIGGGLALCPLLFQQDIVITLICTSLSIAIMMSVNSIYYNVNIDISHQKAASCYGFMGLLFSLAGIISPILIGWILNISASFKSVFIIMIVLNIVSCLVLWFFHNAPSKALPRN